MSSQPSTEVQSRLQESLRAALKARDTAAVSALRSAQAAIGNAEAVTPPTGAPAPSGNQHFAGVIEGLGAAEAPRRVLTEAQACEIVRAEISDRRNAAELYERSGHAERAALLRRGADTLSAVLTNPC